MWEAVSFNPFVDPAVVFCFAERES